MNRDAAPELLEAVLALRECVLTRCRERFPEANGGDGCATPEEQVALELARIALERAGDGP